MGLWFQHENIPACFVPVLLLNCTDLLNWAFPIMQKKHHACIYAGFKQSYAMMKLTRIDEDKRLNKLAHPSKWVSLQLMIVWTSHIGMSMVLVLHDWKRFHLKRAIPKEIVYFVSITVHKICNFDNSSILQFGAPPAIDSGEAKICTVSWENVNKQMLCNRKLHMSMFQMT